MHGGVPFHIAFGIPSHRVEKTELTSEQRNAMSIVLAELNGAAFDWRTMMFKAA